MTRSRAAILVARRVACVPACAVAPPYVRRRRPRRRRRRSRRTPTGSRRSRPTCRSRGNWWEVFGDPQLNALEAADRRLERDAEAARRRSSAQARAAIGDRPRGSVPAGRRRPVDRRAAIRRATGRSPSIGSAYGDFLLPVDVSYEADVWGRVRDTVDVEPRRGAGHRRRSRDGPRWRCTPSSRSTTSRCAASMPRRRLLDTAVTAFERALELTQNRFRGGIASQADVAQAETQLESTRGAGDRRRIDRAPRSSTRSRRWSAQPASAFAMPASPLDDRPAGRAGRPAVRAARAASRHRRRRAARRRRQRDSRRRERGALSRSSC